jgi:hypothetical protein
MFVGRGYTYPTALEGALKLKEVSYVPRRGLRRRRDEARADLTARCRVPARRGRDAVVRSTTSSSRT